MHLVNGNFWNLLKIYIFLIVCSDTWSIYLGDKIIFYSNILRLLGVSMFEQSLNIVDKNIKVSNHKVIIKRITIK